MGITNSARFSHKVLCPGDFVFLIPQPWAALDRAQERSWLSLSGDESIKVSGAAGEGKEG